ncbi:hypothetical protein NKR23_g744 [Pleurostoma richardsiae]|uniref:Uncharacterized protein n=1 Tax=Pleurostoma richardsiae TaxID=41990 RepID=A0AA38VQZ1_9PEZI|nr:hypothetical protein NKR23_g744 [Pleurostoma richardsiae]
MFPVNRQQYRELHELGDEDQVPSVEVWSNFYEIQEELDKQDEMCFVRTVAQFFLHEITLEDYFDRLIGHLEAGSARHTFDKAKSTKLENLLKVDLISGAFKSLMLNRSFRRLQTIVTHDLSSDSAKFKGLCVLTYGIKDVEDLRREAAAANAALESLPPRWVDILAVIAYARRHVAVLQHLVTYPAPSTKSTFDLLGQLITSSRQHPSMDFQHSSDSAENKLIEIRIWTTLLQASGWIHYPMTNSSESLYYGLPLLMGFQREPELRASSEVEKLCAVFSGIGFVLSVNVISIFLSIKDGSSWHFQEGIVPCSLAQATMLFSYFPLSVVAANNANGRLGRGDSATLTLPVTLWDEENPDRLVVMRMLLEQGCDPNDKIFNGGWTQHMTAGQRDTALHLAAERGDGPMVDLLLEFGARGDLTGSGGVGDTPAARARAHRHPRIAARIEG